LIHELNNSLSIVDGYLQFLTGKIPISDEKKSEISKKIMDGPSRIGEMMKGLSLLTSERGLVLSIEPTQIGSALDFLLKIQLRKRMGVELEISNRCSSSDFIKLNIWEFMNLIVTVIIYISNLVGDGRKVEIVIFPFDSYCRLSIGLSSKLEKKSLDIILKFIDSRTKNLGIKFHNDDGTIFFDIPA